MASITSSLEQSLQNCSLNHSSNGNVGVGVGVGGGVGLSATSDTPEDNTLELNSHVSLPYQWEQCLDLKTGEIYYINWMNGAKVKEDPRNFSGDYYTEEDSSYDSEGSSSESSPSSSSRETTFRNDCDEVLVVAGCKSCLMYFMLPKRVEQCPKCNGLLLHFDRSENDSP